MFVEYINYSNCSFPSKGGAYVEILCFMFRDECTYILLNNSVGMKGVLLFFNLISWLKAISGQLTNYIQLK